MPKTKEVKEPPKNTTTLKDVAGYKDEKEAINKIIRLLTNYEDYAKRGVYIPKGLILQGPPGAGKTLLVRAIAGECKIPFFNFEPSDDSKDILKNLKKIFKDAQEYTPSIVYIDEIDKIVTSRRFSSDLSRSVVQYLLTKLDSITATTGIMVIASTNCYEELPESLIRSGRMDKKILIDIPDTESRAEILKFYMKDNPLFKDINIKVLAMKLQGMTGADIKTLINNTLIEYIDEKEVIKMEDFQKLINEMHFETIGKSWNDKVMREKVLAHEIGHALVGYASDGKTGSITAIRYGETSGFTDYSDLIEEDWDEGNADKTARLNMTESEFKIEVRKCFGGIAAEKVYFGEFDTGGYSDIEKASNLFDGLCECGIFGFDALPRHYREEHEVKKSYITEMRDKIFKKEFNNAVKIMKKYKYLGMFLINKAEENKDTLTANELKIHIDFYNEHKAMIIKQYKNKKLKRE